MANLRSGQVKGFIYSICNYNCDNLNEDNEFDKRAIAKAKEI